MTRIIAAALVVLTAVTSAAAAQDYPNRPIKFMHGFPPGGNVDIIGRLLGNEMSKGLGQSIVIEPKPGVAGSLAAEAVARSEPDGYTLLVVPSAHPAHGALSRNVNYKVVEDFEWISVASFYPFLICVRKDSRFQTLTQLIDEARKNPGVLKYGSAGVGSILHTTVELIGNETKNKVSAHSLSRRGAGHDRPPAGGHRFHRGHVRTDQRAHPLGRISRACRHGQDALARFFRRAHGRGARHPGI